MSILNRPTTIRSFLLLQGPVGSFFASLQSALRAAGHSTLRICFNGGDRLYSGRADTCDFRGGTETWPHFLDDVLRREQITDILLFGDCRPLHQAAIDLVRPLGVRIHVFEEGYLRPGWITLEPGGVNGHSELLSVSPALLTNSRHPRSSTTVHQPVPISMPFRRRAVEDLLYTLATLVLSPRYPGYRTHKPWSPLTEYRAGARRFFRRRAQRRHAAVVADQLIARHGRFFLFPLQLDSDAQIRVHSPFGRMAPAIDTVIGSFAEHAPADTRLVISEHPLDQAVIDLGEVVTRSAAVAGVTDRVLYLRGGTPPPLLGASLGLVTVNSTIGLSALDLGRPIAVLGQSIYRIPGLVHEGGLDGFWSQLRPPDTKLFEAFKHLLIERTQLPGGYYGPAARRSAVAHAVERLLGGQISNEVHRPGMMAPEPAAVGNRHAASAK